MELENVINELITAINETSDNTIFKLEVTYSHGGVAVYNKAESVNKFERLIIEHSPLVDVAIKLILVLQKGIN